MLLDFQVENFRSYHEARRLHMVASRQEELPDHLIDVPELELKVLRSAALYGANASGKSNLFKAVWFLGNLLRRGPDAFGRDGESRAPSFALAPDAIEKPTAFEVNFFLRDGKHPRGVRYEYRIGFHAGHIKEEWLNAYPVGGRQQGWFTRSPAEGAVANISFSTTLEGEHKRLKRVTPPNAPFLWVAEKFGHEQLSVPARWLQQNCYNRFEFARGTTAAMCLEDVEFKQWVSEFLRCADLGIVGVQVAQRESSDHEMASRLPEAVRSAFRRLLQYDVTFLHTTLSGPPVSLKMVDESSGTERLFELLGPLWGALHRGQVVFVDEMSASMHPLLTQRLIETFNDPRINIKGAQLILTTHDVSLLRGDLFRRDQVWFTEKNEKGETDLYSLHDFQPRNDTSLAKNYLAGRYGAIPFIGTLDFGMTDGPQQEDQQGTRERHQRQGEIHGSVAEAGTES